MRIYYGKGIYVVKTFGDVRRLRQSLRRGDGKFKSRKFKPIREATSADFYFPNIRSAFDWLEKLDSMGIPNRRLGDLDVIIDPSIPKGFYVDNHAESLGGLSKYLSDVVVPAGFEVQTFPDFNWRLRENFERELPTPVLPEVKPDNFGSVVDLLDQGVE